VRQNNDNFDAFLTGEYIFFYKYITLVFQGKYIDKSNTSDCLNIETLVDILLDVDFLLDES